MKIPLPNQILHRQKTGKIFPKKFYWAVPLPDALYTSYRCLVDNKYREFHI